MKTLWITRKTLLELVREPQLLALLLLLPIFMMGITAVGYSTPKLPTRPVAVVDPDGQAGSLVDLLRERRYPDGKPTFQVKVMDAAQAEAAVKDQTVQAIVTFQRSAQGQLQADLSGDAASIAYTQASVELASALGPVLDRQIGKPQVLSLQPESLTAYGPRTEFDVYAPGMMVFAILLIIPQTAMWVAREMRGGTLQRLRMTPLKSWQWLAGVGLAQMVVALLQVIVMFLAALGFGFQNHGSLLLAALICMALSLSSVGMGLLLAVFVQNDSQALNTGSVFTMLQVFFSGSFFAMPPLTLFMIGPHTIGVFDILPASHALVALQQVLILGAGLEQVSFRTGMTVLLSLLFFAGGVIGFQKAMHG
jgi:ABC-2 type transport system permease protein